MEDRKTFALAPLHFEQRFVNPRGVTLRALAGPGKFLHVKFKAALPTLGRGDREFVIAVTRTLREMLQRIDHVLGLLVNGARDFGQAHLLVEQQRNEIAAKHTAW